MTGSDEPRDEEAAPGQLCALCAKRQATTREHVPAKGLFPRPRPSNLITVPSCDPCNHGTGSDDDHLRAFFALRVEAQPTESLNRVRASVARALTRTDFRGLQETFARGIRFEWLPESGGQVLTMQSLLLPDMQRVLGVVAKNVRGLFYHLTGRILPPEIGVLVLPDHKVDELTPEGQLQAKRWMQLASSGTRGDVGEVFGYTLRVTDDNPNVFAAGLLYFKTFGFLAAAVRPDQTLSGEILILPAGR
jgi:hypothetical protein